MCPREDAGEVNPVEEITDPGQEIKQVSKKKKSAVRLQQGSNPTTEKKVSKPPRPNLQS